MLGSEKIKEAVIHGARAMNLAEAGDFLQVSRSTILKLIKTDNLPAKKVGSQWRFTKEGLNAYLNGEYSATSKTKRSAGKKTKVIKKEIEPG